MYFFLIPFRLTTSACHRANVHQCSDCRCRSCGATGKCLSSKGKNFMEAYFKPCFYEYQCEKINKVEYHFWTDKCQGLPLNTHIALIMLLPAERRKQCQKDGRPPGPQCQRHAPVNNSNESLRIRHLMLCNIS